MCCGLTCAREVLRSYAPVWSFGITPCGQAEAQHPSPWTPIHPNTHRHREVTRSNLQLVLPPLCSLSTLVRAVGVSCAYVTGPLRGQSMLELPNQGGWWVCAVCLSPVPTAPSHPSSPHAPPLPSRAWEEQKEKKGKWVDTLSAMTDYNQDGKKDIIQKFEAPPLKVMRDSISARPSRCGEWDLGAGPHHLVAAPTVGELGNAACPSGSWFPLVSPGALARLPPRLT